MIQKIATNLQFVPPECIDRRSKESTEAHVAAWFGYADALATVLHQLPSEEHPICTDFCDFFQILYVLSILLVIYGCCGISRYKNHCF